MTDPVVTVGQILAGDTHHGLPIPALPLAPGIYFGMDEATYHSVRALSSSGVRDLLVSPLNYWARSPFNADRQDARSGSMLDGSAFHRRLLEPERYRAMYAMKPTVEQYPGAIDGGAALKEECARLGLKKSGTIAELCARILDAEPNAQLWPVIEREALDGLAERELLPPEIMGDIERAAGLILRHQSAAKALGGGMAEVSIFWTDRETGAPMKIRVDYLKTKIGIDVKSFTNPLGHPVNEAIVRALKSHGYGIQAVMYGEGIEAAKEMLRRDKSAAIHVMDGRAIDPDWLVAFAACSRHTFGFLFIERGPVTNVRLREYRRTESPLDDDDPRHKATPNAYWEADFAAYRRGVEQFAEWMRRAGPEHPWIEDEPMVPFVDADFPIWALS